MINLSCCLEIINIITLDYYIYKNYKKEVRFIGRRIISMVRTDDNYQYCDSP